MDEALGSLTTFSRSNHGAYSGRRPRVQANSARRARRPPVSDWSAGAWCATRWCGHAGRGSGAVEEHPVPSSARPPRPAPAPRIRPLQPTRFRGRPAPQATIPTTGQPGQPWPTGQHTQRPAAHAGPGRGVPHAPRGCRAAGWKPAVSGVTVPTGDVGRRGAGALNGGCSGPPLLFRMSGWPIRVADQAPSFEPAVVRARRGPSPPPPEPAAVRARRRPSPPRSEPTAVRARRGSGGARFQSSAARARETRTTRHRSPLSEERHESDASPT